MSLGFGFGSGFGIGFGIGTGTGTGFEQTDSKGANPWAESQEWRTKNFRHELDRWVCALGSISHRIGMDWDFPGG